MKYRIVKQNDKYYPEREFLFFWWKRFPSIVYNGEYNTYFFFKIDAESFIKDQIEVKKGNKAEKEVVYEIKG